MRKRRPAHATTVAVGISAGADDEIFRHAADFSPLTSDLCLVRASEKSCQCKDLSPACREQNRGRRCNRRLARTDSSQNHSCPAPASRSSNRLPSWKPLGSPSACYVRSAARSLQELLLRLALWLRSESQWPLFARACFRGIVLFAAARLTP